MRFDSLIFFVAWLSACCVMLSFSLSPALAQKSNVYTVAKQSVDVKAKDAVTAKTKALEIARSRALSTVFQRITPFNSFDQLPVFKPAAIEDMLESFSVRRERNSATRYIATLDYTFRADIVRKALSHRGIAISDQQSERIAVLPVFIINGKIDQSGRDPWRTAWNELDLENATVPVRLVRAGPSLTMDTLSRITGNDISVFVDLREKYQTKKLVLAIAEATSDRQTLTTRLFGVDRVGSMSLARNDPVFDGNVKNASRQAAAIALGVFAGRWKLMQLPRGGAGNDSTPADVALIVEFSGLREWNEIKKRLVQIPGINSLDIKSLSARTAQLVFQFPGGTAGLTRVAGEYGLLLEGAGDNWILRGN